MSTRTTFLKLFGLRGAFVSTKRRYNIININNIVSTSTRNIRYYYTQGFGRTSEEFERDEEEWEKEELKNSLKNILKKRQEEKEKDKHLLRKGNTVDLNQLLFTKDRDYLIKNNNEQVKAEQLKGKVIGIYSFTLPPQGRDPGNSKWFTTVIKDVYDKLRHDNNFEVVFVAGMDNEYSFQSDSQKRFEDIFSTMPWTAIPFSDVTSREHLSKRSFYVQRETYYGYSMFVIVDPRGVVLQCDAGHHFFNYGAVGYPFSDERISYLMAEDSVIAKRPSLTALLASLKRDYVISNKGDKVPIHTLEDKVVALYFYQICHSNSDWLRDELLLVYDELAKVKKTFQVVLVLSTESGFKDDQMMACEEFFWEKFKTMPWLALPFGDQSCKKLNRIFEISDREKYIHGGIVLVGPRAEFIEPSFVDIMHSNGIPGYDSFTRKKAAKMETEKLKELKLEMLWDSDTVFKRTDGSEVPFCRIAGKRIMLIIENYGSFRLCWDWRHEYFLKMLKERYLEVKGTDDEFEVIRILPPLIIESYSDKIIDGKDMVWLLSSETELRVDLSRYFWSYDIEHIQYFPVLAFDQDGSVVRRSRYLTFEDTKFPFSSFDLEEETLSMLNFDQDIQPNSAGRFILTQSWPYG